MPESEVQLDVVLHVDQANDDTPRYTAAAQWIAARFSLASLTASISIVDDPTIHSLNREELGHDWATDVISFVFERLQREDGSHVDGEIIASADTAGRLSKAAGWDPRDELLLYVIHGLLHLAGLNDLEPDERTQMRQAEQECLIALQVPGGDEHLARWDRVSY